MRAESQGHAWMPIALDLYVKHGWLSSWLCSLFWFILLLKCLKHYYYQWKKISDTTSLCTEVGKRAKTSSESKLPQYSSQLLGCCTTTTTTTTSITTSSSSCNKPSSSLLLSTYIAIKPSQTVTSWPKQKQPETRWVLSLFNSACSV